MSNYINLDNFSEQILKTIKSFDLTPIAFGVVMTLTKDEFAILAKNHPNLTQPSLILKSASNNDGTQWYIQILEEHHLDNNSGE